MHNTTQVPRSRSRQAAPARAVSAGQGGWGGRRVVAPAGQETVHHQILYILLRPDHCEADEREAVRLLLLFLVELMGEVPALAVLAVLRLGLLNPNPNFPYFLLVMTFPYTSLLPAPGSLTSLSLSLSLPLRAVWFDCPTAVWFDCPASYSAGRAMRNSYF